MAITRPFTVFEFPAPKVQVLRTVVSWHRLKDCWEGVLDCGHKMNTGPGSIDEGGDHVGPLLHFERCPTCEHIARQVVPGAPRV